MIAQYNHVGSRQPRFTEFVGANALGKVLPRFVHGHGRTNNTRKTNHVVVHQHAEIYEVAPHLSSSSPIFESQKRRYVVYTRRDVAFRLEIEFITLFLLSQ